MNVAKIILCMCIFFINLQARDVENIIQDNSIGRNKSSKPIIIIKRDNQSEELDQIVINQQNKASNAGQITIQSILEENINTHSILRNRWKTVASITDFLANTSITGAAIVSFYGFWGDDNKTNFISGVAIVAGITLQLISQRAHKESEYYNQIVDKYLVALNK